MQRFRNILLYSNPTVDERAAIRRAAGLAKHSGARLTVISVVKEQTLEFRMPVFGESSTTLRERILAERQRQLDEVVAELQGRGVDCVARLVVGTVFVEVIRQVLNDRHDLLIMAADGKRTVLHRLFGSTSIHLMRKCPCPVWVIKPDVDKAYERVLAAVDVTEQAWNDDQHSLNPHILGVAAAVAQRDHAELHLIQAWSLANEGYMQVRGDVSDSALRRMRQASKRDYTERLERLVKAVDTTGIERFRTHLVRDDDAAAAIIRLVRRQKIDLLVMGTVCRTGLSGFIIGNTAEEVLSAVSCSVLVLKPKGFETPVTAED